LSLQNYLKISKAGYDPPEADSTLGTFYLFLFRPLTQPQAAVIALAVSVPMYHAK